MTRTQIGVCHYTLTMPQAALNSEWGQSHHGTSAVGKAAVPRQGPWLSHLHPSGLQCGSEENAWSLPELFPTVPLTGGLVSPFELNFRKFYSLNSLISSTPLPNFSHCDTLGRYLRNRIKNKGVRFNSKIKYYFTVLWKILKHSVITLIGNINAVSFIRDWHSITIQAII